ncbi:hypothetical protein [Micromonospora sp. NPDC050200]|uniref:hypothetical protein n=1 Tax=Micromonospora sp. NPDC050200 TaxID=3155664 RepID=UPI0033E1FC2A
MPVTGLRLLRVSTEHQQDPEASRAWEARPLAAGSIDRAIFAGCVSSGAGREARRMPHDPQRRRREDDLLRGRDAAGPGREHLYGFFATTLPASLYVWDLAFTFGAYHKVFYHWVARIIVLSAVAFIGLLTLRRELRVPPWLWVAFSLPFILLVLQLLFNIRESHPVLRLVRQPGFVM